MISLPKRMNQLVPDSSAPDVHKMRNISIIIIIIILCSDTSPHQDATVARRVQPFVLPPTTVVLALRRHRRRTATEGINTTLRKCRLCYPLLKTSSTERWWDPFLPRDAMLARYMLSYCVSVCLSVRPSVTSRSSTKMVKPRITKTTPHDSPGTLVCRCQRSRRNSNEITPNGEPLKFWWATTISLERLKLEWRNLVQ